MPNKPRNTGPKPHKLKEYMGTIISLSNTPLEGPFNGRIPNAPPSYIGTLESGERVWLPQHVVNAFQSGNHGGLYKVEQFDTKFGTKGIGLRDAE